MTCSWTFIFAAQRPPLRTHSTVGGFKEKRFLNACMQPVRAFEQVSQKSPDWQKDPDLVYYYLLHQISSNVYVFLNFFLYSLLNRSLSVCLLAGHSYLLPDTTLVFFSPLFRCCMFIQINSLH